MKLACQVQTNRLLEPCSLVVSSPQCGFTSAEERSRITSLELLTTLIMQPRMLLAFFAVNAHYWLMVNLMFTKTPRACSAKMLSRQSAASICWFMVSFLPKEQDFAVLESKSHSVSFKVSALPVQFEIHYVLGHRFD